MARRGPLLALSREHHAALVLARDCRVATATEAAALALRIEAHHRDVLVAHFASEERLLAAHAASIDGAVAQRIAADHAWLRAWIEDGARDLDAVLAYGARIVEHVRFEERIAWPLLQPLLDGDPPAA